MDSGRGRDPDPGPASPGLSQEQEEREEDDEDISMDDVADLLTRFAEKASQSEELPAEGNLGDEELMRLDKMLHAFLRESMVVDVRAFLQDLPDSDRTSQPAAHADKATA